MPRTPIVSMLLAAAFLGAGTGGCNGASGSATADLSSAADAGTPPDEAAASTPDMSAPCGTAKIAGPQLNDITPECRTCVEGNCCDELAACSAIPDCVALRQCFDDCPVADDVSCNTQCNQDHQAGQAASMTFISCRNTYCGAQCADYSCLGKVVWPDRSAQKTLTILVTDYVDTNSIGGATVKVCALDDTACQSPLQTVTTAGDGTATVTVTEAKGGLADYFEISGQDLVTVLHIPRMADPDKGLATSPYPIAAFRTSSFNLLATTGGLTFDPNRGSLVFRAMQCVNIPAPGVKAAADTADGMSTTFYIDGSVPSTQADRTDLSGAGGIANLPPGPVTFTTTVALTSAVHGRFTTFVRAGAVTSFNAIPTP